jgi:hypothetical protein
LRYQRYSLQKLVHPHYLRMSWTLGSSCGETPKHDHHWDPIRRGSYRRMRTDVFAFQDLARHTYHRNYIGCRSRWLSLCVAFNVSSLLKNIMHNNVRLGASNCRGKSKFRSASNIRHPWK